jgi:hypothetical protein
MDDWIVIGVSLIVRWYCSLIILFEHMASYMSFMNNHLV